MWFDVFGHDPFSNEEPRTGEGHLALKIKFHFFTLIHLTGLLVFYK